MPRSKQELLQNTFIVCLLALVCCFLWGSAFPCVKIGYGLFSVSADDTASQMLFAGIRFTLAGVIAAVTGSIARRRFIFPKKRSLPGVTALALVQTVAQYVFFYIGLAQTSGVKSSIIIAANVFFAILISSLLFRMEKLTARKLMGCAAGFAGVILINAAGGIDMSFSLSGEGFLFFSTVAYAFSSVLIKKFSEKDDPFMLSGYQFIFGGLILAAIGFFSGGSIVPQEPAAYLMLLYLAAISAVAYSLWGVLLKHNPVSKVTVFGFMNPVFGVILSALLLGEGEQAFSAVTAAALALACAGIIIVNKKGRGNAL